MKRSERLYLKGFYEAQKELDVTHLLHSIHKLKAIVAALLETREDNKDTIIEEAKGFFYSHMTIYSDSEEEQAMIRENKVMTFLNMDDR